VGLDSYGHAPADLQVDAAVGDHAKTDALFLVDAALSQLHRGLFVAKANLGVSLSRVRN
jgi:hypothetical protein